MSATSSPQLGSFISAIWGIFLAVESSRGSWKKNLEVKNLVQLSLSGKFLVFRETDSSKNISGWFLKPSWAEEKVPESSEIGRRLHRVAELRKSNFETTQSQFHNFF